MSPLAALVAHTLAPRVLVLALVVEWWVVWFICWRHFRATTLYTLLANGLVLGVPGLLLAAGSLGEPAAPAAAGFLAWLGAWLVLLLASLAGEALVLTRLMRRRRPGWAPSRYDLGLLGASRSLVLAAATLDLWLSSAAGPGAS